ncbi:PIR protein, putative [Plasmodium sp. gorilla clade G1]|nr:PIR protein, putative [Plasmodium sp. gorilla clade G1]
MKFNYTNILLFSLSLNILLLVSQVYNQRNHNLRLHKPNTTSRLLCECELYASSNYDNDPEMKGIMQDFDRQTSQRFKEYDERMIKNKQKCKEQCDKDIEQIVVKDKIEKELTEKLSTLQTNISTNDIPTCVCEKSLADKTENFCLKCGYEIGGGVLQSFGLLGGIGQLGLNAWKAGALLAAKKAATAKGLAAGLKAGEAMGVKTVISGLRTTFPIEKLGFGSFDHLIHAKTYNNAPLISQALNLKYYVTCRPGVSLPDVNTSMCDIFGSLGLSEGEALGRDLTTNVAIESYVSKIVSDGTAAAEATKAEMTLLKTAEFKAAKKGVIDAIYASYQTSIIASIIAILVIVLVMVIIYLILRYRRKKKMKKKLQYIKLLKE